MRVSPLAVKRLPGKTVRNIARQSTAEVDFVAEQTGLSLFHCHMQQHMDFGFKMLVKCT